MKISDVVGWVRVIAILLQLLDDPAYPKDWSLSGRSGCLNKKQK